MTDLSVLHTDEETGLEVELSIRIDYYLPPIKGNYHGAWEDSYPDEPSEIEFTVLDQDYKHLEEYTSFTEKVLVAFEEESHYD